MDIVQLLILHVIPSNIEVSAFTFSPVYFIADTAICKDKILSITQQVLEAGVRLVQLRNKNFEFTQKAYTVLRSMQALCTQYHATFIINDDISLSLRIAADGVHLGKADHSYQQAREILKTDAVIGLTIHELEQIKEIDFNVIDYVSIGRLFSSNTKVHEELNSTEKVQAIIKEVRAKTSLVPIFCISGISIEKVAWIRRNFDIDGIAVCSSIANGEDPHEMASLFLDEFSVRL